MQLYNFLLVKRSILLIIFSIILFSCGTYQYSGNINDGIYDENENMDSQQEYTQEPVYDEQIKSSYYQTVFSEKSMQYEETEPLKDSIFTDTESYQGLVENDTIKKNYAPWGEDIDHLTINLYRGPAYNSIHWSRLWNYPIWLNNYGYGYGSVWNEWGYGYNNYWLRPYHYGGFGGYYNNFFNPFWGWGYGYYHPFYRPYNYPYFQNQWDNTSIAYISGGRQSRNASSRSGYTNNTTRISNRVNNLSSSSLRDRISRIDRINSAARVKPSYYSKPVSNYSTGSKPGYNANNTYKPSTKPSSNYNYKPSGSKPSNNSKPSYNSNPSFKPSGSSGGSRPSSSGSSSSGSSRSGGKSGGRSGGY